MPSKIGILNLQGCKIEKTNLKFQKDLQKIRLEHKLNQQELAKKLNYPLQTIQQLENGKLVPSSNILNKLNSFFKVNLSKNGLSS